MPQNLAASIEGSSTSTLWLYLTPCGIQLLGARSSELHASAWSSPQHCHRLGGSETVQAVDRLSWFPGSRAVSQPWRL
jgi:hypothetical protein